MWPWRTQDVPRRISVALTALALAVAGCSGPSLGNAGSGGALKVVAAENFWGSIATQLGGSHVGVQIVVTDPNADPHEYESNTNDARAFAEADLVIMNGAGYDDWATKLLDANLRQGRKVLNVAGLLGKKSGDNPHFWYDPQAVVRVSDAITSDYKTIDGADSGTFDQMRSSLTAAFKPYTDRVAEIKQKFAGTKVGSTESIFEYMATATGLDLISPPEFMKAVSEGNDPPVHTVATFQDQVNGRQIKVLVYNVQTATEVTTNLKHLAAARDIPVVGVSETVQPGTASYQDWMLSELITLENALNAEALVK
jgi:zinc/manganese transport system substrate-binding protein